MSWSICHSSRIYLEVQQPTDKESLLVCTFAKLQISLGTYSSQRSLLTLTPILLSVSWCLHWSIARSSFHSSWQEFAYRTTDSDLQLLNSQGLWDILKIVVWFCRALQFRCRNKWLTFGREEVRLFYFSFEQLNTLKVNNSGLLLTFHWMLSFLCSWDRFSNSEIWKWNKLSTLFFFTYMS